MSIDPTVGFTVAAMVGILVVAEIVVLGLRRLAPGVDRTELTQRIRSWWVIVLAGGIALVLDTTVVLILLALVSYLALKEYLSMIPTRRADRIVLLVAYLAIPTQWVWIAVRDYGIFIVWVPVYLFIAIPSVMVLRGETAGFLRALGTMFWGSMLSVFAIGHVAYLYVLPGDESSGAGLLLMLLLLTQGNDVAQYIWGRVLGRRRVAPTVSPNKTVEGFLGGLVTTTVVATVIGPLLTPLSWPMSMAAGAILAVTGFLGDLTVSAVKRDLGVKDTGSLIPGHGGVLDRVDSLIFAAPLFFHFVHYFYY
ncbi:phosphatidate cytidylyltransferase [Nocardia carnea]|uniref:Phosphatidate cytidylyltransferase n=1 Tax=Nocardia carnea TaxID=37328 RepID=A0ABW7TGU4_9NOCA|nr:phosphatidate cytidylyltransferase [Nocardia carnea]